MKNSDSVFVYTICTLHIFDYLTHNCLKSTRIPSPLTTAQTIPVNLENSRQLFCYLPSSTREQLSLPIATISTRYAFTNQIPQRQTVIPPTHSPTKTPNQHQRKILVGGFGHTTNGLAIRLLRRESSTENSSEIVFFTNNNSEIVFSFSSSIGPPETHSTLSASSSEP